MIDIVMARLYHIQVELELEAALQNKRKVIKLDTHKKCELGKWLYSSASDDYKSIPEIHLLEKEHKLFHSASDKVAKWHNRTDPSARTDARAQLDFEEVQRRSKEVIFLLTLIEFKMVKVELIKQTPIKEMLSKPLETAKKLFMDR
jgi:hypothetical protein